MIVPFVKKRKSYRICPSDIRRLGTDYDRVGLLSRRSGVQIPADSS